MGFTPTTWEGKIAYDPQFEVRRTCRDWDRIHAWARERSVNRLHDPKPLALANILQLLNDPDLDLIII